MLHTILEFKSLLVLTSHICINLNIYKNIEMPKEVIYFLWRNLTYFNSICLGNFTCKFLDFINGPHSLFLSFSFDLKVMKVGSMMKFTIFL